MQRAWILYEIYPWFSFIPSITLNYLMDVTGMEIYKNTDTDFSNVKSCMNFMRLVTRSVELTTSFRSIGRKDQKKEHINKSPKEKR